MTMLLVKYMTLLRLRKPKKVKGAALLNAVPCHLGWAEMLQLCRGKNTSVYVSGLPRDVTEIELAHKFGKLGALRRLKIYRLPSGEPKVRVLVS